MASGQSGERLKHIRELKNMSQSELAEMTGISKGAISMAERNVTAITIDNLAKVCKALQVSADYVVFGEASERDDDWRKLSATEDGLELRQEVLRLYKKKMLRDVLKTFSKLSDSQIDIVIQLAKSLANQPK